MQLHGDQAFFNAFNIDLEILHCWGRGRAIGIEKETHLTHPDVCEERGLSIYKGIKFQDGIEVTLELATNGLGKRMTASSEDTSTWPILDCVFGGREAWQTWLNKETAKAKAEYEVAE